MKWQSWNLNSDFLITSVFLLTATVYHVPGTVLWAGGAKMGDVATDLRVTVL